MLVTSSLLTLHIMSLGLRNQVLPRQRAGCQMPEYLMIIAQSAAKQIQRLQTVKCFYFIHPLVQEWKPAEMETVLLSLTRTTGRLEMCWHYNSPVSQTEGSKHHLPICITE